MNKITEQTLNALDPNLEHWGIKGMKWGVRRNTKNGKVSSIGYRDPRYSKSLTPIEYPFHFAYNKNAIVNTFSMARPAIHTAIFQINRHKEFKNVDLNTDSAKRKMYDALIAETVNKKLNKAAKYYGRSNDGIWSNYKLEFKYDGDLSKPPTVYIKETRKKQLMNKAKRKISDAIFEHADTMETEEIIHNVYIDFDINGFIKNLDIAEDTSIEHTGIKGMKWGVRKKVYVSKTMNLFRRRKNKNKNGSPNPDYLGSLKTKPISKLSNQELERLNRRMQLERTMKDLRAKDAADLKANKGKYIKIAASAFTTATTLYNAYNSPMVKAAIKAIKTGNNAV